jgi:hypothetical protein
LFSPAHNQNIAIAAIAAATTRYTGTPTAAARPNAAVSTSTTYSCIAGTATCA